MCWRTAGRRRWGVGRIRLSRVALLLPPATATRCPFNPSSRGPCIRPGSAHVPQVRRAAAQCLAGPGRTIHATRHDYAGAGERPVRACPERGQGGGLGGRPGELGGGPPVRHLQGHPLRRVDRRAVVAASVCGGVPGRRRVMNAIPTSTRYVYLLGPLIEFWEDPD